MKRVFLLAIAVFEAGNVISATANSSAMLIVGRIVAGAGGGGVMTGSFIIIALSAKPQYRAAYMGVLGVTFGCASVVGPLLGGVLTDSYLTWRWCFWYVAFDREPLETHTYRINLPIGACAAILMTLSFRVPTAAQPIRISWKQKAVSLDLPGAFLVAGQSSMMAILEMNETDDYLFSGNLVLRSSLAQRWSVNKLAQLASCNLPSRCLLAHNHVHCE